MRIFRVLDIYVVIKKSAKNADYVGLQFLQASYPSAIAWEISEKYFLLFSLGSDEQVGRWSFFVFLFPIYVFTCSFACVLFCGSDDEFSTVK